MKIENAALGIAYDLPDSPSILQRDVDDFYRALRGELGPNWRALSVQECAGAYARFAAGKKWLNGVAPKDVAEMPPARVLIIAQGVDAVIGEALTVPKGELS